jgi:CDP-diacylglycerol--glycerol-3-phosphate 3-phosphatidyltransferase
MSLIPAPIRRVVERALEPAIRSLIRAGVSPNLITTIGTVVLLGSGLAFGLGFVRVGGALLLLSGVGDMLDGRVARGGGGETPFGAFYDSTLDRVGEAALFGGIALFFVRGPVAPVIAVPGMMVALTALSAGLIVSYARARAEGLGLDCKVGMAQRAERIVGLGVPSLFVGAGPEGWVLFGIVTLLAAAAAITVVQRIAHVYSATRVRSETAEARPVRKTQARQLTPGVGEVSNERNRK